MSSEEKTPKAGWLASLKALLFGYDFFISYAQDEASRAYGDRLQAMLATRDYVVFRDTTALLAGDPLTVRIRWGLWRTRSLIVLGTERALASEWVKKEIGIFSERHRPVVPVDLENIRGRHPWREIDDALFLNDRLPFPSLTVLERIIASLCGWRANKLARLSLVGAALTGLMVGGVLTWQALNLRDRALRMRTQSLVALAQTQPDSVVRSLILAEADLSRLPDDAVRTAREIARSAIPATILRAPITGISAMTCSQDDRWVLAADDSNVVWRWPIDGKSDPVKLCRLGWRPDRIDALHSLAFCCDDSHSALVRIEATGEPQVFTKPDTQQDEIDKEGPEQPETPRWQVAHWPTAWRASDDGKMVVFCADVLGVFAFTQDVEGKWQRVFIPVPGRAVLDIAIRERARDGSFSGTLVCTDGIVATFVCGLARELELTWQPVTLVPKGEHIRLPDRSSDARAIYAAGSLVVAGLGSGDGIVTASQAENWAPRTFRPVRGCKLTAWTVAEHGRNALLQWEVGEAVHLRLADFHEAPQPPSTRLRVLTQSDYAMGAEAQQAGEESSDSSEMPTARNPGLSPDGNLVLLPTFRNAWLWSVAAGHPVSILRAGLFFDEGIRPAFTHDGSRLVTADRTGEMRVWRADGNELDPRVMGLGGQAVKLAPGRSGQVLTGTDNGAVLLVTSAIRSPAKVLYQRPGQTARCAVSPSGERGAAIFKDGCVALLNLAAGTLQGMVQCERVSGRPVTYEDVEFAGEHYVIAYNGVQPSLVDFATVRVTAQSDVDWKEVHTSSSRAADVMLVKTASETVELVRIPTLEVFRPLTLPGGAVVWSCALSPSGLLAAVGLGDGRLLLFDTHSATAPLYFRVDDASSSVDCLAIDAADRHVAFGTFSGKAGVVDLRQPCALRWFQAPNLEHATGAGRNNLAHLGVISDLRFSADGQRLVTCSGLDGFTRVWQLDGVCVEALHTAGVATFARLLDDGRLVTLTEHGEVAYWRVGIGALLAHLRERCNATLLASERIRYLHEDPATAYARYSEQERQCGRTPLPRDFTKVDYR